MTLFGVDCSDFDWTRGPMDVAGIARDGISFLTHKATEGTRTVHGHLADALNRARAAGISVLGAYHVPRTPGNNGHGSVSAQVDFFLSHLDGAVPWWRGHPAFFLQVDLEHWPYDAVAPAVGVDFADQLKARVGNGVILYAPRWAYGDSIPGSYPLWASDYGANPTTNYRSAYPGDDSGRWRPYSGRTPAILQYGSKLTVGDQPGCDVNAFRGSLADLYRLIGAGTPAIEAAAVASGPAWPKVYLKLTTPMTHSDAVRTYQRLVNRHGYGLVVDGWFGKQTDAATRDFQRRNGLGVDGIVGPLTWAKAAA